MLPYDLGAWNEAIGLSLSRLLHLLSLLLQYVHAKVLARFGCGRRFACMLIHGLKVTLPISHRD
jgi:hypothetical protein